MFAIETMVEVPGLGASEVYDFLTNPNDVAYQSWWPGTHLQFHMVRRTPELVGSIVFMDEFVGTRRIRMRGEVSDTKPNRLIVLQLRSVVRLPLRLELGFADTDGGVRIRHTILAGMNGVGAIFDRLIRRTLNDEFAAMMDEHVRA